MATKSADVTPEEAVRGYIAYLRDPSQFKADDSAAAKVRHEIAELLETKQTADPIEYLDKRVELAAKLQEASDTSDPGIALRADFVAKVGDYLASSGVTVDMLKEVGGRKILPALKDARLISSVAGSTSTSTRKREPLEIATVEAALPADPFTLTQLANILGRDIATVRNKVAELETAKVIKKTGKTAEKEPGTRGRAPALYAKV